MHAILDQLENNIPTVYAPGGPPAAEPTAWTAMALAGAGRADAAGRAGDWLADLQQRDGSAPATETKSAPAWTTSLAILAWLEIDRDRYGEKIAAGVSWLIDTKGKPNPRNPHVGHDTTLIGWSWAADTHSWLEPTAFASMALTAAGHGNHPRTLEARAILIDRLLPAGGCNYGNTSVLGQTLLPHLQPSGVVLWALAGVESDDPRIDLSLEYLLREIRRPTGAASLAYALIALTAWGRRPADASSLVARALGKPHNQPKHVQTQNTCNHALLTLALQTAPVLSHA